MPPKQPKFPSLCKTCHERMLVFLAGGGGTTYLCGPCSADLDKFRDENPWLMEEKEPERPLTLH